MELFFDGIASCGELSETACTDFVVFNEKDSDVFTIAALDALGRELFVITLLDEELDDVIGEEMTLELRKQSFDGVQVGRLKAEKYVPFRKLHEHS